MSDQRLPLVIMAAGLSTRYDELKQLDDVGPSGEALMDYGILDAWKVGVDHVILVVRPEIQTPVQEHVEELVQGAVEVTTVFQELDDLPGGASPPESRVKPWGTAHAVWAAREVVEPGPFLLMNADDFYGADAFAQLADWAERVKSSTEFSMVPYRVADSLSEHGGVSRAVLEVNHRGWLDGIQEVLDIRRREGAVAGATEAGGASGGGGGAAELVGQTPEGEEVALTGDEIYCANLWGMTPRIFPIVEEGLATFLEERGHEPESEFLIAQALRPALARAEVGVRLLKPGQEILGITHPKDRFDVMEALEALVQAGRYPEDLRQAFAGGRTGGPP